MPEPLRITVHDYPDLSETVEEIRAEKLVQKRLEDPLTRLRAEQRVKEFSLFIEMLCMDYAFALVDYETGHLDESFGLSSTVQKICPIIVSSTVPVEFKIYRLPEQVDEKPLLLGNLTFTYDGACADVSDHLSHIHVRQGKAGDHLRKYLDALLEAFEEFL